MFLISLLVAMASLFVLIAWATALKNVFPGLMTINANTAIGMFLCGISMALLLFGRVGNFIRFLVILSSIVIILFGALSIYEVISNIDLYIDKYIFNDIVDFRVSHTSGLMSSATGFCFVIFGLALLVAAQITWLALKKPCVAALGTMVIIISGLAILSNLSIMLFHFHFWDYTGITTYTAFAFMLLGIALLTFITRKSGFNWSLDSFTTTGFAIGILTLLATGFSSYHYTNQLREDDERVSHTQEGIKEINNISIALATLESDQRGYIITGDKKLLENRLPNKIILQKSIAAFYKLSVYDSFEPRYREQLTTLIAQRNEWGDQTIVVREQEGFPNAQTMISTGKGIVLTAEINQLLTKMTNEQYGLLDQRENIENDIFIKTFTLLPLVTFLSLTMLMIGIFLLNTGIYQRKKMEGSRIRLSAIVDSSNDAIIGKNLNGVITSWNTAAEKIFGYTSDEMIGQNISRLIPPDRKQEEKQILNKIKQGEKVKHFETIRQRKDGKLIHVSVTVSPIKNADDEIIGASKMVRDVTEKKELEDQLRQSQKMEAIGQLTGGVAHDFNNLLGIILGNLDLLERMLTGNEEGIKRVNTILRAATRGADLTKRLLAFSRLQQLNPAPTSLIESVNNIVEMATRTFGPEIKIVTKLDPSVPLVCVDASALENALLNLIVNARDAMPKGGSITISSQLKKLDKDYAPVQAGEIKPGVYACVSVTDNGQGMSSQIKERAFEPFFTTKPRGKGTGLGLSMVYGFIKQSGGMVRIYSELGYGTEVSFYLPLATAIPLPAKQAIEDEEEPNVSGTVLIVDDEVDLLEIAAAYLKEMGYSVLQATDAISALAIIDRDPDIKLIITDIIMPGGINGIELAKKVRQKNPNIVIIYSSGFSSEGLAERSGNKIDGPLISKPYQRQDFVAAIHLAIKNHRSG